MRRYKKVLILVGVQRPDIVMVAQPRRPDHTIYLRQQRNALLLARLIATPTPASATPPRCTATRNTMPATGRRRCTASGSLKFDMHCPLSSPEREQSSDMLVHSIPTLAVYVVAPLSLGLEGWIEHSQGTFNLGIDY